MSIRTKLSAAPFAHLLGLGARAEDDDESRKSKRAEDEDEDKKSRRAEEDDGDDEGEDKGKKAKKAKRAEDDGDDKDDDDKKSRHAEEGDGDDEDKSKRGKKAKKAEDDDAEDDDDEDEMKGSSASAKARRRERARCAAIFDSPAAAGIPHVAANLAFNTNMSRKEAISVLQTVAASSAPARRGNLAERMSTQSVPQVGLDGGKANPSGLSPVAAAIVAAGEKARAGK